MDSSSNDELDMMMLEKKVDVVIQLASIATAKNDHLILKKINDAKTMPGMLMSAFGKVRNVAAGV